MRRALAALALLLVGGATFAQWPTPQRPRAAHEIQPAAKPGRSDRIAVSAAALKEAYSAGIVDRPVRSLLNVRRRMSYGDFVWDERGVPRGPLWIRVDLKAQVLSVFRGGDEIGTAVILYGADQVPTPVGRFLVLAKFKDHRSASYDGAPMPYTLRLTSDGVSIHASDVRWGFATHGCIGVPTAFAARLFDAANIGDPVTITPA